MRNWISGRALEMIVKSALWAGVSGSVILSPCLFLSSEAFAQNASRQVEAANKLYAEEKYDEANNKYNDALVSNPESPIINFNIGDVEYQKRNYEKALEAYQKALSADDIKLQSKSYYNMANSLYRLGKLPESILHYRKALELNPDDEDAKYNLEYVRAQLKDKSEKQDQNQQQNQEQQQQDQKQQGENSEQQDQQNEQPQDQQQTEQDQQNEEQNQEQKQQEQDQQNEQDQGDSEEQAQQQQADGQEISKEDAERILNALENEEEDLLKQNRARKAKGAFRGKDW